MVFVIPKKLTAEESNYGRKNSKWSIVDRTSKFQLQQNRGKIYRVVVTRYYSHYVVAESRHLSDILKQWTYLTKTLNKIIPKKFNANENEFDYAEKKWLKAHVTRLALLENVGKEEGTADWMLDDETHVCMKCRRTFTMMRRRHHCIFCGHIFCDKCSPKYAFKNKTTNKTATRQRSCDGCLENLRSRRTTSSRFFVKLRRGTDAYSGGSDDEIGVDEHGKDVTAVVSIETCTSTSALVAWKALQGQAYDLQYSTDSYWDSWETVRVRFPNTKTEKTLARYVLRGLQPGTKYLVRTAPAVEKGKHHKWGRQCRFRTLERGRGEETLRVKQEHATHDGAEGGGGEDDDEVDEKLSLPELQKFGTAPFRTYPASTFRRYNSSSTTPREQSTSPGLLTPHGLVEPAEISVTKETKQTNGMVSDSLTADLDSPPLKLPVSIRSRVDKSATLANKDEISGGGCETSCGDDDYAHMSGLSATDTAAEESEEDSKNFCESRHHGRRNICARRFVESWYPSSRTSSSILVALIAVIAGYSIRPLSSLVFASVNHRSGFIGLVIDIFGAIVAVEERGEAVAALCMAIVVTLLSVSYFISQERTRAVFRVDRPKDGRYDANEMKSLSRSDGGSDTSDGSSNDSESVIYTAYDLNGASASKKNGGSSSNGGGSSSSSKHKRGSSKFADVAAVATTATRWRRRSKSRSLGSYDFVNKLESDGKMRDVIAPPSKTYGKLRARLSPGVPKMLPHSAHFFINEDTRPVPFETPLFRGRAVIRVRGAKGAPSTRYFEGKRRMFSIQVEGRFLRRIRGDSVIFGAAFDHPVVLPYGTSLGLSLLHRIDPAVQEDLQGPQPWAMSPLLCAMSRIGVRYAPRRIIKSDACDSGDLGDRFFGKWNYGGLDRLEEDSALLLSPGERRRLRSKLPWDSDRRRRYFQKKKRREQVWFDPKYVYGFEFMSSRIDLTNYNVSLAIHINMTRYLNGQPLRFEARASGGMMPSRQAIFSFEFPHEDLSRGAKKHAVKED